MRIVGSRNSVTNPRLFFQSLSCLCCHRSTPYAPYTEDLVNDVTGNLLSMTENSFWCGIERAGAAEVDGVDIVQRVGRQERFIRSKTSIRVVGVLTMPPDFSS